MTTESIGQSAVTKFSNINNKLPASLVGQPINPQGMKVVDEALRKGRVISHMMEKGTHISNPYKFIDKCIEHLDDFNGKSTKLSEQQKISFIENKILGNKENAVGKAFDGLSSKMKLASGNPAGSFLGNYTLTNGMMFILEFGSNLDQSKFLLRKYFPDIQNPSMEIQIDRGQGIYGRITGAGYNAKNVRTILQTYAKKYGAGRYTEAIRIEPQDMLFTRDKGSNNFSDGAEGLQQLIAYNTFASQVRIETGVNLDLADAVLRNGYPYADYQLSSAIPTANIYTFSAPLGTYNSATGQVTPNVNLDVMREIGTMITGFLPLLAANRYIREIIVHPLVFQMIKLNPFVQSWFKQGFITRIDSDKMFDDTLPFYLIPGFENIRIVADTLSWNPTPSTLYQPTGGIGARNEYVMNGNNTTITDQSFNGLICVDTSQQGGTPGGVLRVPDVLAGGHLSGEGGYGVNVYDMTQITPQDPHMEIIPFATYGIAPFMPDALYPIDFQVTII